MVLGSEVQRKVESNAGDVQDVPLLDIQLGQIEHALQHRNRRVVGGRDSERSAPKLAREEELSDCLSGKLIDAREHLAPRLVVAEYEQRQVVLYVRRNKKFQSVGGAAQLDEAREAVSHSKSLISS